MANKGKKIEIKRRLTASDQFKLGTFLTRDFGDGQEVNESYAALAARYGGEMDREVSPQSVSSMCKQLGLNIPVATTRLSLNGVAVDVEKLELKIVALEKRIESLESVTIL